MKKHLLALLVAGFALVLHACEVLPDDTTANQPGIHGVEDVTLNVGDMFNPYVGVTVLDEDGMDITESLEILGTDQLGLVGGTVHEPGEHVIVYEAAGFSAARAVTILGDGAADDSSGDSVETCGNPVIGDYEVIWCDEFTGEGDNLNSRGVDLDKWAFQIGTGSQYGLNGWGNDEEQYYREQNARVEDGRLIIEARNDGHDGMPYTSARLWTKPTFGATYGRFEAKIRLPEGDGLWPAYWMMPRDDVYGGWAASGEIDIMEAKGRLLGQSSGAIHYGGQWPDNTFTHGEYTFPEGEDITDFNVYAVEWEEGEIRWYVNGDLFFTADEWHTAGHDFPAPFDQDFYLLLNLAVGGHFDGYRTPPDSLFDDPVQMEIEYVRVYQKD